MTRGFGKRLFGWIAVAGVFLSTSGCFFNLSQEENFKSWYFGEPGMAGALGEQRCDPYADRIQGERHPYYLHFRTMEVFYQPQGGLRYPERSTAASGGGPRAYACEIVDEGRETFNFNAVDAGLVDVVIPFRKATAQPNDADRAYETGSYASSVAYNAGIAAVMKAPVYLVHDVLKTLYIPVAGTYFMIRSEDEAPDVRRAGESDSPAEGQSDRQQAESAPEEAAIAAVEVHDEANTPAVRSAQPAAADVSPGEPAIATDTVDAPAVASGEGPAAPAAGAVQAAPSPPADADVPARTQTPSAPVPGGQATRPAGAAGDVPGATTDPAGDAARPAADNTGPIHEEDLTARPAPLAAAEADQTGQGETPLMAAARVSDPPAADSAVAVPRAAEDAVAEKAASDSATDMASVSASREPLLASSPIPGRLEEVKISKRKLTKQVAFLGFTSRAATVDPVIKGLFEEKWWPLVQDECSRGIRMLRQGEPDYPDALAGLSRDQFGRLNSFEVTTLARFSGINAVVTGALIDIRLSNEIGGLLWYKQPRGNLRVAILVEVYDAETGTKLLDKTLVQESKVEELGPGAENQLRNEDMPFVRAAMDALAARMSAMVCDVLDDQPWRAYVTGIDGGRITLSAGSASGLVAGNILTVHNSQIIEGLNNQQFFLTGERVGRLQITRVHPDHAEAHLIEGTNLRDYSLVIPEG